MKFFTFCVDIKRHSRKDLNKSLELLLKSMCHYLEDFKLIVYSNYHINISHSHVECRDYYDQKISKMYQDKWLNLSFNKIHFYKDLHDEFGQDFIWIDLDTIVCADLSYLDQLDNIFVENGGRPTKKNVLFSNNNQITVPRNRYIQGNFWKVNIDLYNQLMSCLSELNRKKLKLRYDCQDLFSYYIYNHKKGDLTGFNILGHNYLPNTLNG